MISRSSFARLRGPGIGATRAALRFLSRVAIVGGVLLIVEAGLTVLWHEPVSGFLASRAQADLRDDLEAATDLPRQARSGRTRREALSDLARRHEQRTKAGEALGEIKIPSIDVSFAMVQGTGAGDLRKGPGHYEQTVLPGQRGTFGVAGHRTTYLAPFRDIDKLEDGDRIVAKMPYGRFVYEVELSKIVDPTDVSVLDRSRHDRTVLTACNPLYSAKERLVVFARLTKMPPKPPGLERR
jgi:sortase A